MKTNKELRAEARSQLKGNWGLAIGVVVVFCLIFGASGFAMVGPLILGGPLTLGLIGFFVKRARGEAGKFENLFDGFSHFGPSLVLYLLQTLFLMLWSLLLFIPGFIKFFSYSMSFYILRDNPEQKMVSLLIILATK